MSPNFSRYKSEIRSIQRSEIALKKNLIHHPRVIIRFLLPLKTLFSVCFSRLFFLFFPFLQLCPTITRSRPLFQHQRKEKKKAREWTTYNRVIQLRLSTWSNRIVTRPIVNNSRTFNLSPRLQQRGASVQGVQRLSPSSARPYLTDSARLVERAQ